MKSITIRYDIPNFQVRIAIKCLLLNVLSYRLVFNASTCIYLVSDSVVLSLEFLHISLNTVSMLLNTNCFDEILAMP